MPHHYRPAVGIIVINHEQKIFLAKRIDSEEYAWQMPQGGIDDGEDIRAAAFRELEEETSIKQDQLEYIAETKDWLFYDFPKEMQTTLWDGKYKGQKQKWFFMRFHADDQEICLDTDHPEFQEWQWVELHSIADHVVPFKKELYQQLIQYIENWLRETC